MKLEPDCVAAAGSVEPEADAVGDAPVLTALDGPEQRRDGVSTRDRRTTGGVAMKSRKVVVTQVANVAAAEMSGQVEIAIAIDVLEVGPRLAMLPRMQFLRAAECERLVVDAARVEGRRRHEADFDLAILVEMAVLVTELASRPTDVDVPRPIYFQHVFGGSLSWECQRIRRKRRELSQLDVLGRPPLIRRLIEIVDERSIRRESGGGNTQAEGNARETMR